MTTAVVDMAKKSAKPGPKPSPDTARTASLAIRCRPEYKEWVEQAAKDRRMTIANFFDFLVAEYAQKSNRKPPPER